MFLGYYTTWYESAISPWTTWGPLAVVISISLSVEGTADRKRHRNDKETNDTLCVILRRGEEIDEEQRDTSDGSDRSSNNNKNYNETAAQEGDRDEHILKGRDVVVNVNKSYLSDSTGGADRQDSTADKTAENVRVGFQKIKRMNIQQGHFVLVKNREMVPADTVLLASSNDQGGAYIETSSIDGETNLKLRVSPRLPSHIVKALRDGVAPLESVSEEEREEDDEAGVVKIESIEAATKRITRFSALGHPTGKCALEHPEYMKDHANDAAPPPEAGSPSRRTSRLGVIVDKAVDGVKHKSSSFRKTKDAKEQYVAALVTEPPNASVHTFSGKLTLPPMVLGGECYDIPLGAENVLLRGAVLRNTEWAIGLAFFTGNDTKLIQNSHKTPPKFSQLDRLMNWTVVVILFIMAITIVYLATRSVNANRDAFDTLFYAGYNKNSTEPWPYLPEGFEAPDWDGQTYSWLQYFLLYITLLTNFVPLSLYVTVEVVTVVNLWFIYSDLDMYDDTTDTRAVARSTIITDLGRIQYIFSDKTGTLTQNVMRFKRCSVDGMVFGAPIQKTRPGAEREQNDEDEATPFHPLRQLLVGRFKRQDGGLEGLGAVDSTFDSENKLTFNSEFFLRVMSLCHTVVVEQDIDNKADIDASMSVSSGKSGKSLTKNLSIFGRKRANTADSAVYARARANTGDSIGTPLSSVMETGGILQDVESGDDLNSNRGRTTSVNSLAPGQNPRDIKGPDGAPDGFAYQAESPDEGALVSAASSVYGFQVISRDTSGITLRCNYPTHLEDEGTVSGLKSGTLSLKRIAAMSANEADGGGNDTTYSAVKPVSSAFSLPMDEPREEKWAILAVNKFDSDRKRMSILLRSPPELGSMPILFCKGADSAMLDPEVCSSSQTIQEGEEMSKLVNIPRPDNVAVRGRDVSALTTVSEGEGDSTDDLDDVDEEGWEMAQMLGIQSHLGDFAREGLRTLVLGMKILSEEQCEEWLSEYKAAAVSLHNRSVLLTEAAKKIERNLHIVGATAIEDKLQRGVPHTIAQLEKAGIKLWVLTGDKRETAVEIGYSSHVLTPKMHLTEVPDNGETHVRTQMAMEFIRLIKIGKLSEFQKANLEAVAPKKMKDKFQRHLFYFAKTRRRMFRSFRKVLSVFFKAIGDTEKATKIDESVAAQEQAEKQIVEPVARRRQLRARAEAIIQEWLQSDEGKKQSARHRQVYSESEDELSLTSEETPTVFNRATSARSLLKTMRASGSMSNQEKRKLSILHLTAQQVPTEDEMLVDEDTLSLESFLVDSGAITGDYDKRKRTLFERLFAIDKQVRKGRLKKHMTSERLLAIQEAEAMERSARAHPPSSLSHGPRALVIEGAALKFLLGDPELEEILFAVASNCDAVIACRVSPKQKALLVNLVRTNVTPEPVTLAIGDGANDVGMIQEAHVGIGISGKEGKQAVNASDFSIAQFRFLEELLLIHGRWNFFRLSQVVLFSFYKNAVMVGTLVVYTEQTLYSGTALYDEWVIAMLNFVATFPILFLGVFDRCMGKKYVKAHPEVYKATRENELITTRTLLRWVILVFVHIFTIYFLSIPQQYLGGGVTSAFDGLMGRNKERDRPGDGEGGDLKSVGTVTFTCLIFLFAYKVLYENRSLVHGRWPAFTCRKDKGEGFGSRLAYTWIGVLYLSIGFYFFGICIYQLIGRLGASTFSSYVNTPNHVFGTRSISWFLVAFVPVSGMIFDVSGKVFSNMFYPTQTQIHIEIESKEKVAARKRRQSVLRRRRRSEREVQETPDSPDSQISA